MDESSLTLHLETFSNSLVQVIQALQSFSQLECNESSLRDQLNEAKLDILET